MAQHQDIKTGRTTPNIRKTSNLYRTLNIYKVLNIYKIFNIYKILLHLDSRSGTYRVSKVRKDKAYRPVLDAEEVTILLSTNTKGLRILFSKDLYIYLVKEDQQLKYIIDLDLNFRGLVIKDGQRVLRTSSVCIRKQTQRD